MVTALDLFKKRQKWSQVPDCYKIFAKWHQWILWDYRKTGNLDLFYEYQDFRLWLIPILESYNLTGHDLPEINEKNYMKIWFECEKKIDKESLKEFDHDAMKIIVSMGKYKFYRPMVRR